VTRSLPSGPPVEDPIGLFVTRSARTLSRAFDAALEAGGGALPTWLVLASLMGEAHGSQRSIAAAVGIEGATLTHHLARLETDGLVARERDPQNLRVQHVELTDAGVERFTALLGTVRAFDERLRRGLDDDELATLRDLLGRLVANATDAREEE
jgi:MarR family transcriptional regulator for hemolysin